MLGLAWAQTGNDFIIFIHLILGLIKRRYPTRGGVCKLDFRFFSLIVRHASNQLRKPATRGMASQHLRTIERGFLRKRSQIKESQKGYLQRTPYLQIPYLHLTSSFKE